jgi:DNA-binding response OmpR family regulator
MARGAPAYRARDRRLVVEVMVTSAVSPVVLLADDDEDSTAMYEVGLLSMGFHPIATTTVEDTLSRACRMQPVVVIADLTLAGASGVELTRRLRADSRTDHVGIIILTGDGGGSTRQKALDAGSDRVLLKPCLPDVLALEIRELLTQRHNVARTGGTKGSRMSPYEQAFNRIRAEYLEMPGMRLTPAQVGRLSGVHQSVCTLVLDDLVRARFLAVDRDGTYARHADPDRSRSYSSDSYRRLDDDGNGLRSTRSV